MSFLHGFAPLLALLLYVAQSNSVPVDVALNKPIQANVTCGYLSPERFLSHRYVYTSSAVRKNATQICVDRTVYPPTNMVDGRQETWWQSASRRNIINVLRSSAAEFEAEIFIDLLQVCISSGNIHKCPKGLGVVLEKNIGQCPPSRRCFDTRERREKKLVLSRRRGSGRSVIDDIDFTIAILAYFFSRRRLASKQRYCHIRQTICSTRFGVRVCLLIVWCKNFKPYFTGPQNLKFYILKCSFS